MCLEKLFITVCEVRGFKKAFYSGYRTGYFVFRRPFNHPVAMRAKKSKIADGGIICILFSAMRTSFKHQLCTQFAYSLCISLHCYTYPSALYVFMGVRDIKKSAIIGFHPAVFLL